MPVSRPEELGIGEAQDGQRRKLYGREELKIVQENLGEIG